MSGSILTEKVILVTGSTTGIGEAVVRRAIGEGARVMVHGRNSTRAQALSSELDGNLAYVVADLAEPSAPQQIMDEVIRRFGRIDALVNNAALTTRNNIDNIDVDAFQTMVAVNLRAPLFLIKAAVPYFRKQGSGQVINIGSVNAYCGEPNLLAYSMTKGALMTMTRNLADAHAAERIRFNQLNVGWTLTEGERDVQRRQGMPEGWEFNLPPSFAPSGRIFDPAEIASHVVFWLSDAAGPVNGAVYDLEQHPMIGRNPVKEE